MNFDGRLEEFSDTQSQKEGGDNSQKQGGKKIEKNKEGIQLGSYNDNQGPTPGQQSGNFKNLSLATRRAERGRGRGRGNYVQNTFKSLDSRPNTRANKAANSKHKQIVTN